MLKNYAQKTARPVQVYMEVPLPPPDVFNGKSKNLGKDFGSDGLFEENSYLWTEIDKTDGKNLFS